RDGREHREGEDGGARHAPATRDRTRGGLRHGSLARDRTDAPAPHPSAPRGYAAGTEGRRIMHARGARPALARVRCRAARALPGRAATRRNPMQNALAPLFLASFALSPSPARQEPRDPEKERAREHYAAVERELAARDVASLTPEQRAARAAMIATLDDYRA